MLKSETLRNAFIIFFLINIGLYLFMETFHQAVPFHLYNYRNNSHHFIEDSRVTSARFSLINALGQYDAQWYLRNAILGYPKNPSGEDIEDKTSMDGLSYAFFPLYPTLISIPSFFLRDIELSAFLSSNILMALNFLSIIYVIKRKFNEKLAIKTAFLVLLFPFGIFFRSYFTEGLFLLILVWFYYFWDSNKFRTPSLLLGLLNVTRGSAALLVPIYSVFLLRAFRNGSLRGKELFINFILLLAPIAIWSMIVFINTGDFLYFFKVRVSWTGDLNMIELLLKNLWESVNIFNSQLHDFYSSKLDIVTFWLTAFLLYISRKKLSAKLWLISLALWLSPLILSTLMSFSRFQSVSFPLFLYLAVTLRERQFYLATVIFGVLLFITSLYFINWWWVG